MFPVQSTNLQQTSQRQNASPEPAADGQALIEYALLLVLVGIFIILTLQITGVTLEGVYCGIAADLGATAAACADGELAEGGQDGSGGGDGEEPAEPDDSEDDEEEEEAEEREQFLFTDDFSRHGLDQWDHTGNWERDDGEVCSERTRDFIFMAAPESYGIDYEIGMDIELESGQGFMVFFRINGEPGDGYALSFENRGGQVFALTRWNNGRPIWPPVAEERAPRGFPMNNIERRLSLSVSGSSFAAYIDGIEVISGSDDKFDAGVIGMSAMRNSKVCFDDVRVTGWR